MSNRSGSKSTKTAPGPNKTGSSKASSSNTAIKTSKLDLIASLLARPDGASLAELAEATDWQAHSVRGALAGSLKKKGHRIVSQKSDGVRRYRIKAAQQ